jgi:uncharacterized protein with PIN domain
MIVDASALIAIAWNESERARLEEAIEGDPVRLVSAASDLHDAGVMDKRTLRGFDELCLTPVQPMAAVDMTAFSFLPPVVDRQLLLC